MRYKKLITGAVVFVLLTAACGNASGAPSTGFNEAYDYEAIVYEAAQLNGFADSLTDDSNVVLPDFDFEETNLLDRNRRGLTSQARVGARRYMFSIDDEYAKRSFIYITERLINEIGNLVALPSGMAIITMLDCDQYRFENNNITVCHEDYYTFGWLVNQFSVRRIPIWLSVGIETVARSNLGMFEPIPLSNVQVPRGFGEMNFLPYNWGSHEYRQSMYTSYHFARFLHDNGYLASLAGLYIDGRLDEASDMANDLFVNFAGQPLTQYFDMSFRLGVAKGDVMLDDVIFHKTTDLGHFVFTFEGANRKVELSTLVEYVEFLEKGTEFVKEFFQRYYDFDFIPITHQLHFTDTHRSRGHANTAGATQYIAVGRDSCILPIAIHEIAHLFEAQAGATQLFIPFSEGIAQFLSEYFMHEMGRDNFVEQVNRSHLLASARLESGLYLYSSLIGYYSRNRSTYIPELNSHQTSYSFTFFLIENYGIDNFMQVYAMQSSVIERFADVYDISINEMIGNWRAFLDYNFPTSDWDTTCYCFEDEDEICCPEECWCI